MNPMLSWSLASASVHCTRRFTSIKNYLSGQLRWLAYTSRWFFAPMEIILCIRQFDRESITVILAMSKWVLGLRISRPELNFRELSRHVRNVTEISPFLP